MKRKYLSNSPFQTKKLGKNLAEKILKSESLNKAFIIGLEGDLGGGKTTFLQGFAKGLGIREKILSPTFVIMKKFEIPREKIAHRSLSTARWFYHIDCYRIRRLKELLDLGLKKIISDPKKIVVIEWADRIKKILPKDVTWITFEFLSKNKRKIAIK